MDGVEAPTPEVAAYLGARHVQEEFQKQLWRRVAAMLLIFGCISVGIQLYVAHSVEQIQSTVNAHTVTLTTEDRILLTEARCQNQSFNAILKDARLALTGDKNPSDYAKAPKSC